jgi:hypothetical protein
MLATDGDRLKVNDETAIFAISAEFGHNRCKLLVKNKTKFKNVFKAIDSVKDKYKVSEYTLVRGAPWDLNAEVFDACKISQETRLGTTFKDGDVVNIKPKPPPTDGVCATTYDKKMREWCCARMHEVEDTPSSSDANEDA